MADGGGVSGQSADLKTPPVVRKRPFTSPLSRHSRTLAGPHSTDLPNSPGFGLESQAQHQAGVAQLVEQRIRNAKVGSSTLFTGTKFQKATLAVAFCFSGPAKVLPQVDTCALLLGPESMARLEMDRRPSPNYQINHNLIFATAIHSQHINHTLIFKPAPPEQHDQSKLNFPIGHKLIN